MGRIRIPKPVKLIMSLITADDRLLDEVLEVLERRETAEQVRWSLSRLPAKDREILALRYLEELKTIELAQRLDIPIGTVKARIHRALARLKVLLEKNHDG